MGTGKEAQIKLCIIMFAEVLGIDALPLDPEEYAEMSKDIFNSLDKAIELYDGYVDKHEGKVLMATFGVPFTHEDDPERAVRAALLMHKKIEELQKETGGKIQLKIGMNLGRVYAGDVGSEIKREYTVMGDAVNIAARILEKANSSEILVSEDIFQIIKPVFEFSEPIEFAPQGVKGTVKAYNVLRMKSGFIKRRGIEGLQSPLVGRSNEFKATVNLIEKVFDGKGNVVIITGEAGVGKSRLVEELFTYSLGFSLEKAKSINWCMAHCSPYKEALYFPFIELIKIICGIETTDSEKTLLTKLLTTIEKLAMEKADDIFPYIANLFSIKLDARHETKIKHLNPKELKLQSHISITLLLKNYATQGPTVYCIDDLYLADLPTLEALKFLLETTPEMPALIILISRPDKEKPFWQIKEEFANKPNVTEINLARLSLDNTKQISKNLLKIPKLSETLIDEIVSKSEGNPFYLEELIKLLISKGILYRKGSEWFATGVEIQFSIPYTIEGIIRTRFDTMKSTSQGILSEMAIVGRNFSKRILEGFTSYWENLEELITELIILGYIYTDNNKDYSFNHALVREVVYASLASKKLKELHLRVANTIENLYSARLPEFYEILFEHFSKTDKVEKARDYGVKAGDNARKRYANLEAINYYLAVLHELDKSEDNRELKRNLITNLGKVYSLIGSNEEAFKMYDEAFQLCDDAPQKAKIYSLTADSYQRISNYEKALEFYEKALGILGDKREEDKLDIKLGIAWVIYLKGNYEEPRKILEESLKKITDTSKIEARHSMARIYNILGSIYANTGDKKESFTAYNKALKLYELLDDMAGQGVIYNNIYSYYINQGDYYRALDYLSKSLKIDQKTGNLLGRAITLNNLGETHYRLGNLKIAEEKFTEYLIINAQINNQLGNGYGNWGLGLLALEDNNLGKAEDYFYKATTIFRSLGSKFMEMNVLLSIAELKRNKREYEEAYKLCEEVYDGSQKIKDFNIVLESLVKKSKNRIDQGLQEKKLMIYYLQEAKKFLSEALGLTTNIDVAVETEFELYFYLSCTHYYLGEPKETMAYYERARNILNEILKFLPEEEAKKRFLAKKIYREFNSYQKQIGM